MNHSNLEDPKMLQRPRGRKSPDEKPHRPLSPGSYIGPWISGPEYPFSEMITMNFPVGSTLSGIFCTAGPRRRNVTAVTIQ